MRVMRGCVLSERGGSEMVGQAREGRGWSWFGTKTDVATKRHFDGDGSLLMEK